MSKRHPKAYDEKTSRKRLFTDIPSGYKKYLTDILSGYKSCLTETLFEYKKYLTGRVPRRSEGQK